MRISDDRPPKALPAKAVPPTPENKPPKRILGVLAGRVTVSPDFDAPLPDDLLDAFEGR